jgi:hypothetical protein
VQKQHLAGRVLPSGRIGVRWNRLAGDDSHKAMLGDKYYEEQQVVTAELESKTMLVWSGVGSQHALTLTVLTVSYPLWPM